MTPLDDLTLLRSFVRIVESGSISAAARTWQVSQPTLSRHLMTLERQAGTILLSRDTHSMTLTSAGEIFLDDVRQIFLLAEEATHRLAGEQGALRGHLRVFSTIDLGQFPMARLMTAFSRAHPEITIELAYSNRPLRMIEEGCDAGIVVGGIADESVVARKIGEIRRYPVACTDLIDSLPEVRELADLRDWPWVGLVGAQFGEIHRVTLEDESGVEQSLEIEPRLTVEGATGLRESLQEGAGVGLLADWLLQEAPESYQLRQLLPHLRVPGLPVAVIYPSMRKLPLRVSTFVEFASARFPELI